MNMREAIRKFNDAYGRQDRCDKVYEDAAEKQRAYRIRRKAREAAEAKEKARATVLANAAAWAAVEGDPTAILFLQSEEPDILQRLSAVFEERARQLETIRKREEADRKQAHREKMIAAILQILPGNPMEPGEK